MKHGATAFAVSYEELATRLEAVGHHLLTSAHYFSQNNRDQGGSLNVLPISETLDPAEREELGNRLLDQARKMRADTGSCPRGNNSCD